MSARCDLGVLPHPPTPHPYILFIKGTFYRISPPSLCPSPAAIHFNPALVKASWSRNGERSERAEPSISFNYAVH